MTVLAVAGIVCTAVFGSSLGVELQTAIVSVVGAGYAVWLREAHHTARNETTAAANVAAAKAKTAPAAGGGFTLADVEALVRNKILPEVLPDLQSLAAFAPVLEHLLGAGAPTPAPGTVPTPPPVVVAPVAPSLP